MAYGLNDMWFICLRPRTKESLLEDTASPFMVVPNPNGGWAADPFLIEYEGLLYIFAEVYSYKTLRGSIGYCTYDGANFSDWCVVISDDTHYSYPYIFERDDEIFMMPENGDNNGVSLYKAKRFPDVWEHVKVLYEGAPLADTTPLPNDTLLSYLDCHSINTEETVCSLKLLKDGVIVDERKDPYEQMRPAGRIFEHNGEILRQAQDCSTFYGGALNFYSIEFCDDKLPKEVLVKHINPEQINVDLPGLKLLNWLKGTHTYNFSEHYEVVDVEVRNVSPRFFMRKVKKKLLKK